MPKAKNQLEIIIVAQYFIFLTAATFVPNTIFIIIYFSLIIVTDSTSDDHDLHSTEQEKDRHIAQLTRKLQSVSREKEESQEIITTLQTKLQEYKQQLLETTG